MSHTETSGDHELDDRPQDSNAADSVRPNSSAPGPQQSRNLLAQAATEEETDDQQPDVLLDVPTVKVDEISLEVDDLRARVSLHTRLANMLELSAGADVSISRVKLEVKGVEAQALLKVRLKNVYAILDRALTTLDNNPDVLKSLLQPVGDTVGQLGEGAGKAIGDIGQGAGQAVGEVGQGAGQAVEDIGQGTGQTAGELGAGAGQAVSDVGQGAGETVREVGKDAGQAAHDVSQATQNLGENAGQAVGQATRDAGQQTVESAGEAGQQAIQSPQGQPTGEGLENGRAEGSASQGDHLGGDVYGPAADGQESQ